MTADKKTKGMCIATRCTSVEQFIQMFARFVDEESFFVSTHNTRPAGLETSFSVQLADGTPVLRGLCVVMQSWTDANNVFKTPGVRLGIKRLTQSSAPVFEKLLITRSVPQPTIRPMTTPPTVTTATLPPPIPPKLVATTDKKHEFDNAPTKAQPPKPQLETSPTPETLEPASSERTATEADEPEIETRTPGSDYILPANPLSNLTDASLDGFVDCTLYEETGNFFPADENFDEPMLTDDVVPPPVLATRRPTTAPVAVLPANPLAPDVSVSSVVAPLPGHSLVGPLPGNSVVAPLATVTSVAGPLPTGDSIAELLPQSAMVAPVEPMPYMPRSDSPITPLPLPPPRETPVPAGERLDLAPHARRKRPPLWVLGGGFGVIAAATLAIVIGAKSSSGSNSAPKPAVKQPEVIAEVEMPQVPTVDETQTTDNPEVAPATKTGVLEDPEGPPMIGDGPCKLIVATTPAGSTISLDGKALAPSPMTIATTCEKHKIDIAHVRYQTATKWMTLSEGTPGSLDVSLNRPTHAVSVTSTPPGATVFIDGRRAGTTPAVVNVIGFQRLKVEVKKTGFQPQYVSLYSKVARDKVSVKLKKW